MLTSADNKVARYLGPYPPKAAQLIVTIYGDIVEPRGGVLWMGDLITLCMGFGVNESLVRTAVSRLVSKGQLAGEREGRRSFYGLTPAARQEYHLAAELFFGPEDGDCAWLLTLCSDAEDQATLARNGFVQLSGSVFAAADRSGRPVPGAAFRAEVLEPENGRLRRILENAFQLDALAACYTDFVTRFTDMQAQTIADLDPQIALLQRLALVHGYREIRLRDPRLPVSVLPDRWPARAARSLFANLYRQLSEPADAYIGQHLLAKHGPLPSTPEAVRHRMETLSSSI